MKNLNIVCTFLFLASIFHSPQTVQAAKSIPTHKVELNLPTITIDNKLTQMMAGPFKLKKFKLPKQDQSKPIWIKRLSVQLTDPNNKDMTEFLCHALIHTEPKELSTSEVRKRMRIGPIHNHISFVSQGMTTIAFPEGFALKTASMATHPIGFMGMVTTYDHVPRKIDLNYTASLEYYRDEIAKKHNVTPLRMVSLFSRHNIGSNGLGAKGKTHKIEPHHHHPGHTTTTHWMVPPGEWTYVSDVGFDKLFEREKLTSEVQVHFIRIHLHPYGESVELINETTGELVWKGTAKTHEERAELLHVDTYSSKTGIRFNPKHKYKIRTVYKNTTDYTVNAMSNVRLYIADKEI